MFVEPSVIVISGVDEAQRLRGEDEGEPYCKSYKWVRRTCRANENTMMIKYSRTTIKVPMIAMVARPLE